MPRPVSFVITCPASYARAMQAAIAVMSHDIRRDQAMRAAGRKPTIPDSMVDHGVTGATVITLAPLPSELDQLREAMWPQEPSIPQSDPEPERKVS